MGYWSIPKTQKRTELWQRLNALGACEEALEFVGDQTPQQAWERCEDDTWLCWLIEHVLTPHEFRCAIHRLFLHRLVSESQNGTQESMERIDWPSAYARWLEVGNWLRDVQAMPSPTPEDFWNADNDPHPLRRGLEMMVGAIYAEDDDPLFRAWPTYPELVDYVDLRACVKLEDIMDGLKSKTDPLLKG